jgi:hypothetical protein
MQMALRGEVMSDEVEDFAERWHNSPSDIEIYEYLGMTWEEYSLWVSHPDYIDLIIAARRNERPILEAVNDNLRYSERLAARADDAGKLAALRRWIAAQPDR